MDKIDVEGVYRAFLEPPPPPPRTNSSFTNAAFRLSRGGKESGHIDEHGGRLFGEENIFISPEEIARDLLERRPQDLL
jgi:hypothetical protein